MVYKEDPMEYMTSCAYCTYCERFGSTLVCIKTHGRLPEIRTCDKFTPIEIDMDELVEV